MPRYSFSRQDILSQSEVEDMIKGANPELQALIAFLYLWGARIGEALSLTAGDFAKSKNRLKARILTEKVHLEGPIKEQHRSVAVDLSSPFTPYLLEYLSARQEGKLWSFNRVTAWRRLKKLNSQCSPHIFRHTRATKLASRTNNPYALMAFFGWSDLRPAMKYIHASGSLALSLSGKID